MTSVAPSCHRGHASLGVSTNRIGPADTSLALEVEVLPSTCAAAAAGAAAADEALSALLWVVVVVLIPQAASATVVVVVMIGIVVLHEFCTYARRARTVQYYIHHHGI